MPDPAPSAAPDRAAVGFEILAEIACSINSVLDLDRLYLVIYEQCSRVFETDNFWIGVSTAGGAPEAVLRFSEGRQIVAPGQTSPIEPGLNSEVLQTRRTLCVDDYDAARRDRGLPPDPRISDSAPYGWLGVPMLIGDRLIGMIANSRPRPFSAEDARLLEAIAALCAVAIENAGLVQMVSETAQDLMRRTKELWDLNNIASAVNRSLDLPTVLAVGADMLLRATGWDIATVCLRDPFGRWETAVHRHAGGIPAAGDGAVEMAGSIEDPSGPLHPFVSQALATGRPVAVDMATLAPPAAAVPHPSLTHGLRRAVLFPLRGGVLPGTPTAPVVGLLLLGSRATERGAGAAAMLDDSTLLAIGEQLATAVQNARLLAEVQSAAAALERRTRELAGINAVAAALNRSLDLTTMLDQAASAVLDVTGWDRVALHLWNPLSQAWDRVTRRGGEAGGRLDAPDTGLVGTPEADLYTPITADLLAGRPRAFQVGDQWAVVEGRWAVIHAKYAALRTPEAGVETRIAFPIYVRTETLGMLELGIRRPIGPDEIEARLGDHTLRGICEQLALAIENARLYAEARQVAALEERQHLARELHDSVTQSLFTVTLMAEAAQAMVARDPSRVGAYLERLKATAGSALSEMRALLAQLRPTTVGVSGLGPALRRHAETVGAQLGLDIDVAVDPALGPLPTAIEDALYRIAQEALHNIIKHAGAQHARVRLAIGPADDPGGPALVLTVEDDGRGFDATRTAPVGGRGLGLTGMRERAAALGGHLTIDSTPGHGSRVVVAVPLPADAVPPAPDSGEAAG
ncbi:MAG TPA: GAF domain-containing sensor histidine kinase [Chloroflexia bacterium]|nr:GAF domain-containing sensor histidine kinase [Chloroflexia bacterium]